MEIRNFTQFTNLLVVTQCIHLNPSFGRLHNCMITYNSLCNCGNANKEKDNKKSECNRIYREAIGSVDSIKAHLFKNCKDNTISFYIDNTHHVKTISR